MKIHHVGYLVDDIKAAEAEFLKLGFTGRGECVHDPLREAYILFMNQEGYTVELIQPVSESSPIYRLRKKRGNSPYHLCYETDDILREIENMTQSGAYKLLQSPQAAPAIENRLVAFLVGDQIGMIELCEVLK